MDAKKLLARWENGRKSLRTLAECIPTDSCDCRDERFGVTPEAMSLGATVLHCASAEKSLRDSFTVTPGKLEWNTGINLEHFPLKKNILAVLDRETEITRKYLAGLTDTDLDKVVKLPWGEKNLGEVWLDWVGHEIHHRGTLIPTLRAAGVTPPSIWG
jgi:uncharacterized damage-inducible protein DinB